MIKKLFFVGCIFFVNICSRDSGLNDKINSLLDKIPASTKYGILIYNPVTKDTLYKRNIYEKIKPASNIKLFTTAAAIALIGSDSLVSTKILTDDFLIDDGIINGNLYIKGFGNPLFTDIDLDSLALVIRAKGITTITGKIIGDDSYFDNEYKRSDWIIDETIFDPLPPVSAITINRNRIQFSLKASSKSGGAVKYSLYPSCSLISVKNLAKTVRGKTSIRISQNFKNNNYEFIISGGLRRQLSTAYMIEIENPPLFAAILLKDRLIKAGIKINEGADFGESPNVTNVLCEKSYSIKYLCGIANKRSDNFIAECLFKTLGACFSENIGSGFYGTQAIFNFLKENRIYSDGVIIVDGSGLSHQNQVTVLTIVNLLERIYKNPHIFFDYYNSLSIAGRDGTLRNRFIGSNAENNFRGKTGSLRGVLSLSGFMKSQSNEDLIISMLFEYESPSESFYEEIRDSIIEML